VSPIVRPLIDGPIQSNPIQSNPTKSGAVHSSAGGGQRGARHAGEVEQIGSDLELERRARHKGERRASVINHTLCLPQSASAAADDPLAAAVAAAAAEAQPPARVGRQLSLFSRVIQFCKFKFGLPLQLIGGHPAARLARRSPLAT